MNVHGRLQVVLVCIVDDDGGNDKVEEKRGILHREATLIDLTDEDDGIDDLESDILG